MMYDDVIDSSEFYVTWQRLIPSAATPSPCPREMFSAAVIVSPANNCTSLVIAGGRSADAVLSDVWMLQSRERGAESSDSDCPFVWRRLLSMELPHPRCAHTTAVVPDSGLVLIYGGFTGMGISDDIIVAKVSNMLAGEEGARPGRGRPGPWTVVTPSESLGGRFGHSMTSTCADMTVVGTGGAGESRVLGALVFGGIDAEKDFRDVWALTDFV